MCQLESLSIQHNALKERSFCVAAPVLSQLEWCFSSQEIAWVMNELMFE